MYFGPKGLSAKSSFVAWRMADSGAAPGSSGHAISRHEKHQLELALRLSLRDARGPPGSASVDGRPGSSVHASTATAVLTARAVGNGKRGEANSGNDSDYDLGGARDGPWDGGERCGASRRQTHVAPRKRGASADASRASGRPFEKEKSGVGQASLRRIVR